MPKRRDQSPDAMQLKQLSLFDHAPAAAEPVKPATVLSFQQAKAERDRAYSEILTRRVLKLLEL